MGIIAFGAYLRLWNIEHLFNVVNDYDEGAWSLAARFISQGYFPYQDFMLDHPPFYYLVLAGVYKVFGYSFFYGRYLAVALSLACIILIFLVGKKLYHPTAGIIAAALFAVSPEMVFFGRRTTPDILGIFLLLLAVYFAVDFINSKREYKLLLCGLALGLAVAIKYVFVPAAVAIILAIIWLSVGESWWRSIKSLGRPTLWAICFCCAAIFYSLLLLLKWSLKLDISVPFIDPMYWSVEDVAVAVLVFLLPLVIAIVMLEKNLPIGRWSRELWKLRYNRGIWLLLGGTALGFLCIIGFFLIKAPQEFISQTILIQQNRPLAEFPSLVGIIRIASFNPTFVRMASVPVLLVIPLVFILLNKVKFYKRDCFVAVALITSFAFCQMFFHVPRYYVSVFPFLFLGISWLLPPLDTKMLTTSLAALTARFKVRLLIVLAVFVFSLSMSVVLLTNYTGYLDLCPIFSSNEERVYQKTVSYLETIEAEKVYGAGPISVALSAKYDSSLAVDTFGILFLEEKPPKELIQDLIDEGVDYVVLDSWIKVWSEKQAREFIREVRRNATLVKVIEPDGPCSAEIYRLGAEGTEK